jgi:hypothetical protein
VTEVKGLQKKRRRRGKKEALRVERKKSKINVSIEDLNNKKL